MVSAPTPPHRWHIPLSRLRTMRRRVAQSLGRRSLRVDPAHAVGMCSGHLPLPVGVALFWQPSVAQGVGAFMCLLRS